MQSSHLPILPKDIKEYEKMINSLLATVKWKPVKSLIANGGSQDLTPGNKLWRPSAITENIIEDSVSLIQTAKVISDDPALIADDINSALRAIRTGFCIGLYLAKQYGVYAGLRELEIQNRSGRLSLNEQEEFRSKITTSSAVALYSTASYVVWKLSSLEPEKVSNSKVEFHGIPELSLLSPQRAIECSMYYLGAYLDPKKSGLVKTETEMVSMIIKYFTGIIEEVKTRQGSLKHIQFFTEVSYQLSDTDFIIDGFESVGSTNSISIEFRKIDFGEIVGNRDAKHEAKRLAQRLVCYDLKAKKNPFIVLGGLQGVRMGYSIPGTGKSMLIAATATLMAKYCEMIGVPFLFWPLPDNVVSTFQGGSAERMVEYMKRLQDDNKIVYGSIDDAENVLEARTRQGVSAGVREVIGVFLRFTEGAYAINRGNSVVEIFTNLPEQIDPAVMSRIQSRFKVDGAVTNSDFIDQDYLWWRKLEEVQKGFVDSPDPKDYKYLSDQTPSKSRLLSDEEVPSFTDYRIGAEFTKINVNCSGKWTHENFAELYVSAKRLYPNFSSRDVRNIQTAVSTRIMDFDLPDLWFEKPDLFFSKDYDTKLAMIQDLMKENMGTNMSFTKIRLIEAVRYLNNLSTIASADRERRIAGIIENTQIENEAVKRLVKS